jgi:hypothetical protein
MHGRRTWKGKDLMSNNVKRSRLEEETRPARGDAPGIVIADGGVGSRMTRTHPRVRAFVYGERMPSNPTLPFGRWKAAS